MTGVCFYLLGQELTLTEVCFYSLGQELALTEVFFLFKSRTRVDADRGVLFS
jgi:hypothetical protein